MIGERTNSMSNKRAAMALLLALLLASPLCTFADKNKKKKADANAEQPAPKPEIDTSKLVWPSPPSIARVRYLNYFAGEKIDTSATPKKKKQSWMDRLAGEQGQTEKYDVKTFPFQLLGPFGMAFDSKGLVVRRGPESGRGIHFQYRDARRAAYPQRLRSAFRVDQWIGHRR